MDTIAPFNVGPSLRLLLVYESQDDAELLELAMLGHGYTTRAVRVDTAARLEIALRADVWDVVLCEHGISGLDALTALRVVHAHGVDVPFIVVSNIIDELSAVEVMRAGAHDFLFKHSLDRLRAVVDRELREAALRSERRRMQQQLLLSDRLSAVGMLAAGVAHEINNPLSYVLGNVQFAIERLSASTAIDDPELAEVVEALTQAREGSQRVRNITRDLKVFCRRGDDAPEAPIDVRKVMDSAIGMAWNELRHRARLIRRFEPVPHIVGDESRLGQVFLNLLVNAAQALPEGQAQRHRIVVSISYEAGAICVEVQDSGCGMTAEQQRRVFEPFFTTKPRGVGTGLGLSICASIVSQMGGEISVDSQPGQGTTFRLAFRAREGLLVTTPPPQLTPDPLPHSRILVVDDEPALCTVIRRLLRSEHEVVGYVDAREALQHLQRDSAFDIVICDIMMPNMSGREFFLELSRLEPELAQRTVFMTGGTFDLDAQRFLGTVTNPLLQKPFETRALHYAIGQILDGSSAVSGTWRLGEVGRTA